MKKYILNNILRSPGRSKIYAQVIKPLGNERYQIRDSLGRSIDADSAIDWKVGDGVVIDRDKRIIGSASRRSAPRVFRV